MNANTKGLIQGANHKNLWAQLYVKLWSQEETWGRLREEPKSLFISHIHLWIWSNVWKSRLETTLNSWFSLPWLVDICELVSCTLHDRKSTVVTWWKSRALNSWLKGSTEDKTSQQENIFFLFYDVTILQNSWRVSRLVALKVNCLAVILFLLFLG